MHIAEELRLKEKAKEQAEEEARFYEESRLKAEKEEQERLKAVLIIPEDHYAIIAVIA